MKRKLQLKKQQHTQTIARKFLPQLCITQLKAVLLQEIFCPSQVTQYLTSRCLRQDSTGGLALKNIFRFVTVHWPSLTKPEKIAETERRKSRALVEMTPWQCVLKACSSCFGSCHLSPPGVDVFLANMPNNCLNSETGS